jgi:hypothetical protein
MNPPIRIILERLVENVIELFCICDILYGPVRLLEVNEVRDRYISTVYRECVTLYDRRVTASWNGIHPCVIVVTLGNLKLERCHYRTKKVIERLLINLLSLRIKSLLAPLVDGHAPVVHLAATHGATTLSPLEVPSLDTRLAKLVPAHKGAIGGILVAHWALHYRSC